LEKNKFIFTACIFIILIIAGCKNKEQDTIRQPIVRAALKASGTNSIKAQVFVEGPDGNALSGAVVTVRDDNNSLLQLPYEAATGMYISGLLRIILFHP